MARLYKNMEIFQLGYALAIDIITLLDKFPLERKRQYNLSDEKGSNVNSIEHG